MDKTELQEFLAKKLSEVVGEKFKDLDTLVGVQLEAKMKEMGIDKIGARHMNDWPGMNEQEKNVGKKAKVAQFIKSVFKNDVAFLTKGMTEGQDSAGGFLVPEEFSSEIDRIAEDFGLIRKLARNMPMTRDALNQPVLGSGATVTWPGEGNNGTDGSPTFGNVRMVAKTAVGLAPVTNELLADANVSVVDVLMELFGEALAGEEDNQAFNGTGNPFVGLLVDSNVTTVTMASGKDTFPEAVLNDYRDLISQIKSTVLPGSVFIMHRLVWAIVQETLQNSQNVGSFMNPIVTNPAPQGGLLTPQGYLWGYPVYLSDKMPSTTAVSTKYIIFGNFKYFYRGDRQQMAMDISNSATVGSINAFQSNQSIVRVLERVSLNVGLPTAFSVLKTAAS